MFEIIVILLLFVFVPYIEPFLIQIWNCVRLPVHLSLLKVKQSRVTSSLARRPSRRLRLGEEINRFANLYQKQLANYHIGLESILGGEYVVLGDLEPEKTGTSTPRGLLSLLSKSPLDHIISWRPHDLELLSLVSRKSSNQLTPILNTSLIKLFESLLEDANDDDFSLNSKNSIRYLWSTCETIDVPDRRLLLAHLSGHIVEEGLKTSKIVAVLKIAWPDTNDRQLELARSQLLFNYANRLEHLVLLYPSLLAILDAAQLIEFGSKYSPGEASEMLSFTSSSGCISRYMLLLMLAGYLEEAQMLQTGKKNRTLPDDRDSDVTSFLILDFLRTFGELSAAGSSITQIRVQPKLDLYPGQLELVRVQSDRDLEAEQDLIVVVDPLIPQLDGSNESKSTSNCQVLKVEGDGGRKLVKLFDQLGSLPKIGASLADLINQSSISSSKPSDSLNSRSQQKPDSLEQVACLVATGSVSKALPRKNERPARRVIRRGLKPILTRTLILASFLVARWLLVNYLEHVTQELKQDVRDDYIQLKRELYGNNPVDPLNEIEDKDEKIVQLVGQLFEMDSPSWSSLSGDTLPEPMDPPPFDDDDDESDTDHDNGKPKERLPDQDQIGQLMEVLVGQILANGNVNMDEMMAAFRELEQEGVDTQLAHEGLDIAHFRSLFRLLKPAAKVTKGVTSQSDSKTEL